MTIHPLAGQPAPKENLVNVAKLMADYYSLEPQSPVAFGTSGHRGSALKGSFNEAHVAAVVAAAIEYRSLQKYQGPLFLGFDTHGLSEAAFRTALEVLAAHEVPTVIARGNEYSPTPVISFMIIEHNRAHPDKKADGLIITPSHNPPQDGGIKYNPPHGGPADVDVTGWIEKRANELLPVTEKIKRLSYEKALKAACVTAADFMTPFIKGLGEVVDMEAIKNAKLKLGADPLGGSGVHFWQPLAEYWGLDIDVVNPLVDPSFSFMTLDSDGAIRMDCSSPYAMQGLLKVGDKYDLAFGNDPDFDRHGIVSGGQLMNPNHYLAVAINYLLEHRPHWPKSGKIGKTLVSSNIIDKVVAAHQYHLYEVPVGFKWFVEGLAAGSLLFGGEESAGASYLKKNGQTWTTDKDGFCMALLGAEIIAKTGKAPHEWHKHLSEKFGASLYGRVDSPINDEEKKALNKLEPQKLIGQQFASQKIVKASTAAPGNQAPIGGLKVLLSDDSWFALRPSGTEPKMKLYLESFSGQELYDEMRNKAPLLLKG